LRIVLRVDILFGRDKVVRCAVYLVGADLVIMLITALGIRGHNRTVLVLVSMENSCNISGVGTEAERGVTSHISRRRGCSLLFQDALRSR